MSSVDNPSTRELATIWIAAVLLASAVLAWALYAVLNTDVPPSQAFYEHNAARVDEFAQRIDDGAIGVVMMGDSRMRYGTETDDVLSAELSQALGHETAVLRLVNNWAVFEDFEELAPAIKASGPTLVVIQDELRAKNRADDATALLRREYLVWRTLGSGPWNPGDLDQDYLQLEMRCEVLSNESVERRRERVFQWVDFDPTGPNATKVARFEEQLADASIDVRYLTVPITTEGEAGLPGVAATEGPSGLQPDVEIANEDFCDVVHMNPSGRQHYTDWFVSAVQGELADLLT